MLGPAALRGRRPEAQAASPYPSGAGPCAHVGGAAGAGRVGASLRGRDPAQGRPACPQRFPVKGV